MELKQQVQRNRDLEVLKQRQYERYIDTATLTIAIVQVRAHRTSTLAAQQHITAAADRTPNGRSNPQALTCPKA